VPTGHSRRVHALLYCQGETAEEVASIARTLRARSVPVDVGLDTLDIVGTGGDGIGSVNISTGACVIAAAAGARVAKHGSRSVSSLCGSADVLEVLHRAWGPGAWSLSATSRPCLSVWGSRVPRRPGGSGWPRWAVSCTRSWGSQGRLADAGKLERSSACIPAASCARSPWQAVSAALVLDSAGPVRRLVRRPARGSVQAPGAAAAGAQARAGAQALGVAADLGPDGVARCLREVGLGFMFASRFNPALAAVNPTRKALRVRTAFNLLGSLLNPAATPFSLVGVYAPGVAPLMADVLRALGSRRALVVHSAGLDELTPMAPADVVEVTQASTRAYRRAARPIPTLTLPYHTSAPHARPLPCPVAPSLAAAMPAVRTLGVNRRGTPGAAALVCRRGARLPCLPPQSVRAGAAGAPCAASAVCA